MKNERLFQIVQNKVNLIKETLETAVSTATFDGKTYPNGQKAKEGLIRSSKLINLLHEAIKEQLAAIGIDKSRIVPAIGASGPELKLAGFLKMKDQDVCVFPKTVQKIPRTIGWGPLQFEKAKDPNGFDFTEKTLVINLRSQLTSLEKNADTLFERTFAEPMNLHVLYPKAVLGDVYLIPVYPYDEHVMLANKVRFKPHKTNVLKYISFFSAINGRKDTESDMFKYERCALVIVDFSKPVPKIYTSTQELIDDGLIKSTDNVDFNSISIDGFVDEIVEIYNSRFGDIKKI
jgi:hypothetical protein